MPDAIVIGAGLTGLAATHELERQGLKTTLIEVKRRVGGSIRSVHQDGFVMDAGAFALADTFDATQLDALGLGQALHREGGQALFRQGTQTLVDALERQLEAPRLMRMAVSSVGQLEEGDCGVCLENGLLLRARGLIITVPLTYAERLFYGYITEITETFLALQTQAVQRVSWGLPIEADLDELEATPEVAFIQQTRLAERVPAGQKLVQVGIRAEQPDEALVGALRERCAMPEPTTQLISAEAEALRLPVDATAYQQAIATVKKRLPPQIALVGSDYGSPPSRPGSDDLAARMQEGQQAARQIARSIAD